MKYSYIGIAMILALLPISLVLKINYVLPVLVAYYLWLLLKGKKGHSFVIISFAMCIAYTSGLDDTTTELMADMFKWVYRSMYFCLLLASCLLILKQRYFKSGVILVSSLLYLLINSMYGTSDFISSFFKILLIPLFFNVCYIEKLDLDDITRLISVLFIGVGGYAMLDFFFEIGPYMMFYKISALYEMEGFHRANGLLGNSLSLSAVTAAFFVFLLIKWYLQKKIDSGKMAYCLAIFMTTGSRTSIVVAVAVLLVYFIYIQRNVEKVIQIGIPFCFGLFLLLLLAYYFLPEHMEIMFGRFEDTSEHRMAGWQTSWNIFTNNPLGVGSIGMEKVLLKNASYGFLTNLKTLDNFYLTQFAKYGIFCPIAFLFYFCYSLIAFRKSMNNKLYRIIVFLFFPWALLGFSFGVDGYQSVTLLFFGLAGHLFRIIEHKQYGVVNNHRKLQHA